MNICLFGSRRSGTTVLANTLYSAMRTTGLRAQQQLEPFAWHMVQIDNKRQDRAQRIGKEFHESIPLLCGPGFKSEELDAVMDFDGVNVIKFNLALGRIPLIASYPDTVTIHIFRDPVWVMNSIQQLNFDLGTVGLGRIRNDWSLFFHTVAPYLSGRDRLTINAARWMIENLTACGLADLMFSYKSLLNNPVGIAKRLFELIDHDKLDFGQFLAFFRGFADQNRELILSKKEIATIKSVTDVAYRFLLSCEGT